MKTKTKNVEELFSSKEEFEKAIAMTQNFLNEKILSVRLPLPGRVIIRIDEQKLNTFIFQESFNKENYKNILQKEIAKFLESLLHTESEKYSLRIILSDYLPFNKENFTELDEIEKLIKVRIEYVKQHLFNSVLNDCNLIKKTSKINFLENISWNISIKKHDLDEGDLGNIPYCSIRFLFRKPAAMIYDNSIFTEIFFGNLLTAQPTEISSDFHLKDIDDLIEDLQTIKNNLVNLSNEDE